MLIPLFSSASVRWVALSFAGLSLFAAGMWFDYQRGDGGPGGPADSGGAAPSARPAGEVKTLPASSPSGIKPPPADGSIFIRLEGLGAENTVTGQSMTVLGSTSPDAILSAAGVPVPVGTDGRFETNLELNPGPNFIEFVASNLRGQQTSRVVAVISQ